MYLEEFNVELSPPPSDIDEMDMDFHITGMECPEFGDEQE